MQTHEDERALFSCPRENCKRAYTTVCCPISVVRISICHMIYNGSCHSSVNAVNLLARFDVRNV